ncbi:piRNA biogenesis protein EXD1 [Arctopsyche grandis]|uniref:piRNA biogenesis protein EXD1 n=1 Tax=Arctopsyche grandis TaxID=121162 RepID=UPI00406DA3ED
MENTFLNGDFLEIEIVDGAIFTGWLDSQKKDKSSICLLNVKEMPKGIDVEGRVTFYSSEVKSVQRIKEPEENNAAAKIQSHVSILTNVDIENLELISKKFIFINKIDEIYHRAIDDLNHCAYVAVGTEGSEMGRKCTLPLLTLSTPTQIYIFDVKVLHRSCFDAGLEKILESNEIKKIIHNSRKLSDCLYHKHQVKLTNVFDTQVADVIVHKNKFDCLPEKLRTLQECMTFYLGLKENITEKVHITEWSQRPLKIEIKETASTNIVYLHRLSEVLQEEMLSPFKRGVAYFVDRLRQSSDYEAWTLSSQEKHLTEEFQEAISCKIKK